LASGSPRRRQRPRDRSTPRVSHESRVPVMLAWLSSPGHMPVDHLAALAKDRLGRGVLNSRPTAVNSSSDALRGSRADPGHGSVGSVVLPALGARLACATRVGCQLTDQPLSRVESAYRVRISGVCNCHGGRGHEARYGSSGNCQMDQAAWRYSWIKPPSTSTRCTDVPTVPGSTSVSRGAGRGGCRSRLRCGRTVL
jgi:hypothetical protein